MNSYLNGTKRKGEGAKEFGLKIAGDLLEPRVDPGAGEGDPSCQKTRCGQVENFPREDYGQGGHSQKSHLSPISLPASQKIFLII